MNIIQANVIDTGLQILPTRYTFQVPDGVNIKKGTLLKVDRYSVIFKAITNSAEISDEALNMITDGREITSSVVGVYEYKELKLEEQKEPEEVDWSKVEVDTPIMVKDRRDADWIRRYFAKYEGGKIYAWNSGATSWSVDCNVGVVWKYTKLAEVDND